MIQGKDTEKGIQAIPFMKDAPLISDCRLPLLLPQSLQDYHRGQRDRLVRMRQEDFKFKACFGYRVNSKLAQGAELWEFPGVLRAVGLILSTAKAQLYN